jgi:restriction endonuclease S subunit
MPFPKRELKHLAVSIFSGAPLYSVSIKNKEASSLPLINIKDIVDDQITWQKLEIISLNTIRKPDRFYVEAGDVLITCRGTQFKVAVVPPKISQAVITANLIAIRPKPDQVSAVYLAAYLQSKDGERELLARRTSQTAQIVLSLSSVEELCVPLPPLSIQEKISRTVETLDEEYRLNQRAAEINRQIRTQIITDMLEQNKEINNG